MNFKSIILDYLNLNNDILSKTKFEFNIDFLDLHLHHI
jgi:hypothetical protein